MRVELTPTLLENFWAKVNKTEDANECWEWTGARNKDGYGAIKSNGLIMYVHRLSVVLAGRRLPDEKIVHHTCGNRLCVNPEHLQITNHDVNNATWNRNIEERKPVGIQLDMLDEQE